MLVLDGSSSVDPAEWQVLLDGYADVISKTVPGNGTYALGVVQFSGGDVASGTRVEIPLQVIPDIAGVDAFVDKLENIQQMGSSTNPGDGVVRAAQHIKAEGRENSDWSLCVSPEGVLNAGTEMDAAREQAVQNEVDRLGFFAIEDPPGFTAPDAAALYGPHVFGGMKVTSARTTGSFAEIAYGCFIPSVELRAVEVNQAVQDWNNSVPLVARKDTVVRVFFQQFFSQQSYVPTTGRLRGYRDGNELPGSPLESSNRNRAIQVDDTPADGREVLDGSLNFNLPGAWTTGTVELVPEVPGALECPDPRWTDRCGQVVSFTDREPLRIKLWATMWEQNGGPYGPTPAHMYEQLNRIVDSLPVAASDVDVEYGQLSLDSRVPTTDRGLEHMLAALALESYMHGIPSDDRVYYAALRGTPTGHAGAASGRVAAGWLQGAEGVDAMGFARNVSPHEVGHTLGLPHTVHEKFGTAGDQKHGDCDEDAPLSTPDYPYWSTPAGWTHEVPTLGPNTADPDRQIWGAVPRYFESGNGALGIVNPYEIFSLMGYCEPVNDQSQGKWVDIVNYRSVLNNRAAGTKKTEFALEDEPASVMLRGDIDTQADTGTFAPTAAVFGRPATADDPNGRYQLRLKNAGGDVVHQVRFDVHPPEDVPDDVPQSASFQIAIPETVTGAVQAELVHNGAVIGRLSNAPDTGEGIRVSNVKARPMNYSRDLEVTWDGGTAAIPPTYTVQYTADNGTRWHTIATGITPRRVTAPRWTLPGAPNAKVRVIASHGLRTGNATSAAFELLPGEPQLTIDSPVLGSSYSGAQTIVFKATAFDPTDGFLDGDAITWRNNGEVLGTGAQFQMPADTFVAGPVQVDVTARSSGGEETVRSVQFETSSLPKTE